MTDEGTIYIQNTANIGSCDFAWVHTFSAWSPTSHGIATCRPYRAHGIVHRRLPVMDFIKFELIATVALLLGHWTIVVANRFFPNR